MRAWVLAALALVPLAGCLGGTDASSEAPDGGPEAGRTSRGSDADADGILEYAGSFALVLNPDNEAFVVAIADGNTNCVLFWDTNGADYRILDGNVTLAWDAASPLAEELVLAVEGGKALVASGTSPLTMPLPALEPEGWGLSFRADHALPNVPVQQAAKLDVSFRYEGELPRPGQGMCTDGL